MSGRRGRDAFYVGYQAHAPASLAPFLRRVTAVLLTVVTGVAVAVALAQAAFAPSVFEFGTTRMLEGTLLDRPWPRLVTERPGGLGAGVTTYLLTAAGKHGAGARASEVDGRRVLLRGTLAYRENAAMLELAGAEAVDDLGPGRTPPPVQDLGTFTLTGEIVDAKCFLGVMNPGSLKTHRACAIRCLSGGIPPLFVVRDTAGVAAQFLLITVAGAPVGEEILDRVAEPIRITGLVHREGDLLFLRANPSTYERVP